MMKKIPILLVVAVMLLTMTSFTMVPACSTAQEVSEPIAQKAVPVILRAESQSIEVEPISEIPIEQPVQENDIHRDDIVSDGNMLSYELQETMQEYCAEYDIPYALLLAIADTETHFDPDAVSPTNDYGLMQINKCNHEWLLGLGFDPMTHEGNIAAGAYIISSYLQKYGEIEPSLMAYNCGPTGAKKLWDVGVYQTDYTIKVMSAFEHWTKVLNNYEEE